MLDEQLNFTFDTGLLVKLLETLNATGTQVKSFKCTTRVSEEDLPKIEEEIAKNYSIERFCMQWADSFDVCERYSSITNRNRLWKKQKRFKAMKVADHQAFID